MNNQKGFSVLIIILSIVVIFVLVGIFGAVHHSMSANKTMNTMKTEIANMHIPNTLLTTKCNAGDGVDSTPTCTFTYQGSNAKDIVASVEAAGYNPLSTQPINYSGSSPIVLVKDKTSPHAIDIYINSNVELEIN